jgi:hypothetical protein
MSAVYLRPIPSLGGSTQTLRWQLVESVPYYSKHSILMRWMESPRTLIFVKMLGVDYKELVIMFQQSPLAHEMKH